jgi:hypothetical protein
MLFDVPSSTVRPSKAATKPPSPAQHFEHFEHVEPSVIENHTS